MEPEICSYGLKICSFGPEICSFEPEICSFGLKICGMCWSAAVGRDLFQQCLTTGLAEFASLTTGLVARLC